MQATELKPGLWKIDLSGFLDAAMATRIESRFKELLPDGGHDVTLNLSDLEYCGSLGIRMLLMAAKLVQQRGGKMVLASPQAQMQHLIRTVRLEDLLPVVPNLEEAQALLG